MLTMKNEISKLLNRVAETLDIPSHLYEDAILKYQDLAEWLSAEDSDLKNYQPEIYPQGSFRLGTVVRPIFDHDEYDIDLVCRLLIEKAKITQEQLKDIIGDRIKKRADLSEKLKPSRRCWVLTFPKQFHMDVLPAVPDATNLPNGILLTDTELRNWQFSNPTAYAEWFYSRMIKIFQQRKESLAKLMEAKIEEVPDWQVRTPLQRAVQLLKRHRDIYFTKAPKLKPASIIITTLAGHAYGSEEDLYAALNEIIHGMPKYIERRDGKWWIPNPVHEGENFADKWNEESERSEAFFNWLNAVQSDIAAVQTKSLLEAVRTLTPSFGGDILNKAAEDFGISTGTSLIIVPKEEVPELSDARHCQRLDWPERLAYKAEIEGSVHLGRYSKKKAWDLTTRPVPKRIWLKFKVKTNTPYPYEIKWQVVNTGKEALDAGQLRGDFYSDDGGSNIRWESTLYAGTHWVEAFVIKNGFCVARTGRKLVKIRK